MIITRHNFKARIIHRLLEFKHLLDNDYKFAEEQLLKQHDTNELISCGEMHLEARALLDKITNDFKNKF